MIESKPERRLYKNHYWKVNLDWIKQEICKLYNGVNKEDMERELIKTEIKNNYGNVGTYVFSLKGSPPKGYGFYLPEAQRLIIISMSGNKTKKCNDTIIEGINADKF